MYRNETHVKSHSRGGYRTTNTQTYFVQHDFDGPAKLTTTLAHAISDVSGIDVTDTGFSLADHVDPDALDRLFRPKDDGTPRMDGHLTFTVWGYQVTVYSDGQIAIVPPQGAPDRRGTLSIFPRVYDRGRERPVSSDGALRNRTERERITDS